MTSRRLLLAIGASDVGGGQKVFLAFAKELHRRGRPAVVVVPEGPLVELVKPYAETLYVANLASVLSLPRIAWVLWRERIGIINTHLAKCGLLFALVNVVMRRRLFCSLHNDVTHEALGPSQLRVYPFLYRLLQSLSDGIIAVSEHSRRNLVDDSGMDPSRITVIHPGIDIDEFAEGEHHRASAQRFVIGAVGRLLPDKGHGILLRALARLKHLDWECRIAGVGPLRLELERAAGEEGIADRIHFLGFESDMARAMSPMDLLVMPSLYENLPVTIMEAFAEKTPVIASDVGGIPELVSHGTTGVLVPPNDPVALAQAIEHAILHKDEGARMARNAHAFIANTFTGAAMTDRMLEYLETGPEKHVKPVDLLLAIGASGIGGGQKVFLSYARELHRRGSPAVIVLPAGPLVELVRPFAARLYVANLASVTSLPRITRILWKERSPIINTHLTKCGLLFAIVNLLYRRRLFSTLFNAVTHEALGAAQRRAYPLMYRVLERLSDGIIVNSAQSKRHVVEVAGMAPDKVAVVYSGIDIEAFAGQLQPRAPGGRFVIGAVGRLAPEKGQAFLVRALGHLRHIDCVCLLIGDGPMRHELERLVIQEGVADRVRFLGFQERVAQVMSQLDVVVMPSLDETFGITIVEAFALKKMVIASDVGGIPELVHSGTTGLLVPARDSVALAGAIEYAFSHRAECEQMGQNAYAFAVNTFTTAAMVDGTLQSFHTGRDSAGAGGH